MRVQGLLAEVVVGVLLKTQIKTVGIIADSDQTPATLLSAKPMIYDDFNQKQISGLALFRNLKTRLSYN